jgi:hypothetical protein
MVNIYGRLSHPEDDNLFFDAPAQKNETRAEAKKTELTEAERTCQEFVEQNKKQVSEALSRLFENNKFVLVGESHLSESEPLRHEIVKALGELQKEGLTHIALEVNSSSQAIVDNLDFTDPQIRQILKERKVAGIGWGEGNMDILIASKLLGLNVVLIDHDDGRPDSMRDNAQWQNQRDERMVETLRSQIAEDSKVLVFIGSSHVHKQMVEGYSDGKIKRLGMRLVEEYSQERVASVRYVGRSKSFDNLPGFMSKTPSPDKISRGKNEVVIIPDQGPVKGDDRVSAADYIITVV